MVRIFTEAYIWGSKVNGKRNVSILKIRLYRDLYEDNKNPEFIFYLTVCWLQKEHEGRQQR